MDSDNNNNKKYSNPFSDPLQKKSNLVTNSDSEYITRGGAERVVESDDVNAKRKYNKDEIISDGKIKRPSIDSDRTPSSFQNSQQNMNINLVQNNHVYLEISGDNNQQKIKITPQLEKDQSLKNQKQEPQTKLYQQKCWPSFLTISSYLIADQKKKQRSFQIGVFTIFLVVSFLTLLKAAVDVVPVAFVKIGQDQAGAIDFRLTPSSGTPFVEGNYNFYTDNPFQQDARYNLTAKVEVNANDTLIYDDHISVRGFNILKFDYFDNKSKELTGFEGFAPRWTLLTKLRNITNPLFNTSSLLIIIDSKKEVDIGLGRYFSQRILGENEMMATNAALQYLDVDPDKRDPIEIQFDFNMLLSVLGMVGGNSAEIEKSLPVMLAKALSDGVQDNDVYFILKALGMDIDENGFVDVDVKDILEQTEKQTTVDPCGSKCNS